MQQKVLCYICISQVYLQSNPSHLSGICFTKTEFRFNHKLNLWLDLWFDSRFNFRHYPRLEVGWDFQVDLRFNLWFTLILEFWFNLRFDLGFKFRFDLWMALRLNLSSNLKFDCWYSLSMRCWPSNRFIKWVQDFFTKTIIWDNDSIRTHNDRCFTADVSQMFHRS